MTGVPSTPCGGLPEGDHPQMKERPMRRTTRWLRLLPARSQRGDVPGWVLITVMTAALVAGLLAIAGPELNQMLRAALASVG